MSCQKDMAPLKSKEPNVAELIASKRSMPGVMATVNGVEFISTSTDPLSKTQVSAFSSDETFPSDSNLVNPIDAEYPIDSNEVFPIDTNLVNPIDSNVYVITDPIYVDPNPVDSIPFDDSTRAVIYYQPPPSPYYATFGSNDSSLIILADGQMPSEDSVQYAKILLWITRFKGEDTYSINDFSSFAVFSIVDSTYNLRQYAASSDLPNNGNVTITYYDKEAKTISGTFEFTGVSNNDLMVVKNGVFNFVKIN